MACPAILTGDEFLIRMLAHVDCQARSLGTFGYQSLGEPGSTAATVTTALLTLFIALYGIRLLFGPGPGARDTVYDVLKIGIVLTLAFSWPAWKTVVHDVVIDGPAEIAAAISPPVLTGQGSSFADRLQATDLSLVELTTQGTGRQTGADATDGALGGTFAGAALRDEDAFGNARLFYLAGVIGALALLRLAAGVLLALTPLAAGLLLFGMTRGLFSGWLRGLTLTILGTVGATVVLAVELAILEPWLADVLRVRALGYATPAAPIELFAITLAFAAVLIGMVWITGRIAFTRGWLDVVQASSEREKEYAVSPTEHRAVYTQGLSISRAERISESVSTVLRREEGGGSQRIAVLGANSNRSIDSGPSVSDGPGRLGSSYRRTARRSSGTGQKRDARR